MASLKRLVLPTSALVFLLCLALSFSVASAQGEKGREEKKVTPTPTPRPKSPTPLPTPRPQPTTNRVVIELGWIPPGSFVMGSESGQNEHVPVHRVTINEGFYMGKYEVTQSQWKMVTGNNPSAFKGDRLPVETVSWVDAMAFIAKLNAQHDGYTYRLPTEAEWEYAARAGTTGDYAGDLNTMAWYLLNSGSKTHPVGQKQPNAFGLFDMHGNVWEWCQDWFHDNYAGAPTDGSAWLLGGEQKYRVFRGGAWDLHADLLRVAVRYRLYPDSRHSNIGLRVVAAARQ